MMKEVSIKLECCGADHKMMINEEAISRREPNEVRKNVLCLKCGKVVILEFTRGDDVTRIRQEVIRLKIKD